MLGMMNCQTENYEFYASPPSSAHQLRQSGTEQQQSVEGLEVFSKRKHKAQITYTDCRRLIDGKLGETSRKEPTKLWSRAIVDNLTARRLRRESSNRKEVEEGQGEGSGQLLHPAEERDRQRAEEQQQNSMERGASVTTSKQKRKSSLCSLLSRLKSRKPSYAAINSSKSGTTD
uniref:Uncharacterized protein n=1 Tax=Globodera pallida TaxID=36090 RepID=A0A183C1R5_GLOPA